MAQMQSPARFSVTTADHSPLADSTAFSQHTNTIPEPFYTDQDVVILHDIVALAQEDFSNAASPKPLPAAALFKAYDEVLPQYGIDPDGDHHLSAFIFRIGGEEGNASLLEKFQTVLSNLGITVDLGDGPDHDLQLSPAPSTTRSVRSAFGRALRLHSRRISDGLSTNRQPLARVPELEGASWDPTEESSLASPAAISTGRHELRRNTDGPDDVFAVDIEAHDAQNGLDKPRSPADALSGNRQQGPPAGLESDLNRWIRAAKLQRTNIFTSPARTAATSGRYAPTVTTPERPIESRQSQISQYMREQLARPANPSPPSLMSLIDAWRGSAALHSEHNGSPSPRNRPMPEHIRSARETGFDEDQRMQIVSEPSQPQEVVGEHQSLSRDDHEAQAPEPSSATKQAAAAAVLTQAKQEQTHRQASETPLTQEETLKLHIKQQKLMYRAARARELYLASKFFNQWADRTARRLEREGVARRHMVRFRCFRGWSQMPSSREPEVDQLRLSFAMQKLRRATSDYQQNSGHLVAQATQSRQRSSALCAISKWRRGMAISEARDRAGQRLKARCALRWRICAAKHAATQEAARLRGQQARELSLLAVWRGQAEEHAAQNVIARDLGDAGLVFSHLKSWWDKSEASRRAAVYRKYMLNKKAVHALSSWNLAARCQAFKWNHDYRTVSRTFDRWEGLARSQQHTAHAAHSYYASQMGRKVLGGLNQAHRDHMRLRKVQGRVRLFITATRTLDVFDEVVKRHKADEKDRVKKRLMSKYKQASAARKKRQFFAALSLWQESATNAQINAQFATDTIVSRENRQRAQALETWTQQSRAHEQNMDRAIQQYGISWIDRWTASAVREAERESQAWETWAVDRQRTALKDWSILALQRGGQAHTASAAYQKHSRDRRRRILQLWKQQKDKKQGVENLYTNRNFTPGPGSLRSYRQSWRFFSEKGHAASNRTSIMSTADTPTRWTGQLSLMSSTMGQNPMPAVDEADEPDLAKSPMSDGLPKGFDSPVRGIANPTVFGTSLSTTPMAPVPTHLRGRLGDGARPSPWPRSAYGQRPLYVPSKLGPTRSQRLFPRSVQQQSSDKFGGNDKDLSSSMFFPSADRQLQAQAQDTAKPPHLVSDVVTGSPRPATALRPFKFSKSQPAGAESPRTNSALAED